jgi:hypothetical protein
VPRAAQKGGGIVHGDFFDRFSLPGALHRAASVSLEAARQLHASHFNRSTAARGQADRPDPAAVAPSDPNPAPQPHTRLPPVAEHVPTRNDQGDGRQRWGGGATTAPGSTGYLIVPLTLETYGRLGKPLMHLLGDVGQLATHQVQFVGVSACSPSSNLFRECCETERLPIQRDVRAWCGWLLCQSQWHCHQAWPDLPSRMADVSDMESPWASWAAGLDGRVCHEQEPILVAFGVDLRCNAADSSGDSLPWSACVCLPVWFCEFRALIWNCFL